MATIKTRYSIGDTVYHAGTNTEEPRRGGREGHGMTPLQPLTTTVRMPDQRYFELHQLCASGDASEAELAELHRLQSLKIDEHEREYGDTDERPDHC